MMSSQDFSKQIQTWAHNKEWLKVKISAKKRLEAKGIIDLGIGSYWRFMDKEWFEKAKQEEIIKQNAYGQWVPLVVMEEKTETIGRRGKDAITKIVGTRISQESLRKLKDFSDRYEAWKKRTYQTNLEFNRIIESNKDILPTV